MAFHKDWKSPATPLFVLPLRLFAPALVPYQFGKFVESQVASAVEFWEPLKLRIKCWPLELFQKSLSLVAPTCLLELETLAEAVVVVDDRLPVLSVIVT